MFAIYFQKLVYYLSDFFFNSMTAHRAVVQMKF